jgi:hypothetical protein
MCETVEIKEQDNVVIENELQKQISSEELVESDVKTEEKPTEEQKNDELEEEEANEEKEGFLVVQNDSEEPEAVTPSSSEEEEEEIHLTESEAESDIKEDEYGREYLVHNDIRYYREPRHWNTPYLVELSLWLILFINFFDAIGTLNQLIPSRK